MQPTTCITDRNTLTNTNLVFKRASTRPSKFIWPSTRHMETWSSKWRGRVVKHYGSMVISSFSNKALLVLEIVIVFLEVLNFSLFSKSKRPNILWFIKWNIFLFFFSFNFRDFLYQINFLYFSKFSGRGSDPLAIIALFRGSIWSAELVLYLHCSILTFGVIWTKNKKFKIIQYLDILFIDC